MNDVLKRWESRNAVAVKEELERSRFARMAVMPRYRLQQTLLRLATAKTEAAMRLRPGSLRPIVTTGEGGKAVPSIQVVDDGKVDMKKLGVVWSYAVKMTTHDMRDDLAQSNADARYYSDAAQTWEKMTTDEWKAHLQTKL